MLPEELEHELREGIEHTVTHLNFWDSDEQGFCVGCDNLMEDGECASCALGWNDEGCSNYWRVLLLAEQICDILPSLSW